ncbi:hypothetical protein ACFL2J_05460, partial [Candidatus Omnitrophota bacterium]
ELKNDNRTIQVIDYSTGDGFPENTPKKISESKHGGFYFSALRAGWSIRELQRYAMEHFGEQIGRDCFHRFSKLIPVEQKLPQPLRDKYLKGIDVKVDCLQELQNMIEIQKHRVSQAMEFEETAKREQGVASVLMMKPIREEIQFLWSMIKELTMVQVNLGIVNHKDNVPRMTGVSNDEAIARRIVDDWTPEQKDKFVTTVKEIEKENTVDAEVVEEVVVTNGVKLLTMNGMTIVNGIVWDVCLVFDEARVEICS